MDCEFDIDDCEKMPCQNGGICHDMVNDFRCTCPTGTLGLLCEIDENDCYEGACYHNGTCVDRVGGFDCLCPSG